MSDITYQEEAPLRFTSPEANEAAAAVAAAFQADAADLGLTDSVEAAPEAPAPSQPAPPAQQQQPEPVVEAGEPEPFDFRQFEPNLTPDLEELLEDDTPDFEQEARAELATQAQYAEDTGEYVDYDGTEQAAKLLALEKRNAFLEQRLVETNRGKWVRENLQAYPLAAQYAKDRIEAIQATSRRGFAREAAKINADVTAIAKPLLDDLKTRLAAQGQIVTDTHRQQVQAAWGVPMIEPAAGGDAAARQAKVEQARKTGDLQAVFKAELETGGPIL